jgi:hypothetical protein
LIVPPQRTPDTAEAVPTPAPVPNEFKEFIEREPSNGDDSRPVQVHPAAEPRSQRLSGVSTPPTDKSPPTPSAKTAPDGSAMHSSSEDAAVHHRRMLQEKIRRRAEA